MLTFVTFTTGNYTDMTENLLVNFEQVLVQHGHRIILICMDPVATQNLAAYKDKPWVIFESRDLNNQTDIGNFNSPSFNTLNNYKPVLLRELLEKYDSLYWIDSDIVFYADPEQYVKGDMIFQQDGEDDTYRLCTGNFYMKKTEATFRFLDTWIEKLCDRNEQFLLNEIVHGQYGSIWNIPWISVDVFPPEKFQRGHDAFKLKWWHRDDKVCIHVNYVEGFENKKEGLKMIGAWYIDT
jgi:hypothetical protein